MAMTEEEKAVALDDVIIAAIGPAYWNHDVQHCECAIDAPENEEAFMTLTCAENYHTGTMEQTTRAQAIRQLLRMARGES